MTTALTPATAAANAATTTTTTPSKTAETGKTTLSSDFETFLKMLTVQMQNQDPLNPVESSEFAVQLATFSSVEQQVLTNDLLKSLNTGFGSMGMAQMAHWVGMEARVEAAAQFSGTPIEVIPDIDALADSATLLVKDADGTIVQRLTVDPKSKSLTWAGVDSDGAPMASGLYTFDVESYAGGKLLKSSSAQVYTRIDEVQSQNGSVSLVLSGGTRVDASAVTALRNP